MVPRYCDGILKFLASALVGAVPLSATDWSTVFAAPGIVVPLTLVRIAAPEVLLKVALLVCWMSIELVSTPVLEKLFET